MNSFFFVAMFLVSPQLGLSAPVKLVLTINTFSKDIKHILFFKEDYFSIEKISVYYIGKLSK